MAEPQKIPTLAEVLMMPVIQPLIKKPLLGKQRLPLAAFLSVGGFLFETGAMLGWAYRDSQLAFVRVTSLPETPDQLVRLMRLKAKERVAEWESPDDSINDSHTEDQWKLFSANAKEHSKIFIVVVPKGSETLAWRRVREFGINVDDVWTMS